LLSEVAHTSPNSPAMTMLAVFLSCVAIVAHGRRLAFAPSGPNLHATSTRRQSAVPPATLYSALAARGNKKVANIEIPSRFSVGMPKMADDKDDEKKKEKKGPELVYEKAWKAGEKKVKILPSKLLAGGFISGCHVALGSLLAVSVGGYGLGGKTLQLGLTKIFLGMFGLPLALLMTLIAGGELVTGGFSLCYAAFLEGKTTLRKAWNYWLTVITGNFFGSLLIAWIAYQAHAGFGDVARDIAVAKCNMAFSTLVAKGILCNWLVAMAIWMATSAKDDDILSKAFAIFFPVSGFVALGLEHSVANMFLIPFGMYNGADVSTGEFFFRNLLPVTLGNLIGGAFGVAQLYKAAFGKKKEKKKDD